MAKTTTELRRVEAELVVDEDLNAWREQLRSLADDELRDQLAVQLDLTAQHLTRIAMVVRELEDRGQDLSDLKLGLLPYLRRIAYGQTAPEIVVRYAGFPSLIQRVGAFPLPEQRRIASGHPVELAVREGDVITHRKIDPLHLSSDQLYLVFARDHVRSVEEQIALLESGRLKPRERKQAAKRRVKADRSRGGIVIGRSFAALADVLAALADLKGTPLPQNEEDDDQATIALKLPAAEHRRLKILAAQSDTTLIDLVRRALAAHGLLREDT